MAADVNLGRGQATPTNAAAVLAVPSKTSDITLKISKTVMKPRLTCHMRQNPTAQHESHVFLPPRVSRSRERGRRKKRRVFGRDTGLLARSGCVSSRVKARDKLGLLYRASCPITPNPQPSEHPQLDSLSQPPEPRHRSPNSDPTPTIVKSLSQNMRPWLLQPCPACPKGLSK